MRLGRKYPSPPNFSLGIAKESGIYPKGGTRISNLPLEGYVLTTDQQENSLAQAIDALGTDAFHRAFAHLLSTQIAYDNVISMIWVGTSAPKVVYLDYSGPNVFRRLEDDYLSSAFQLDPFFRRHQEGFAPGIYRLVDFAPDNFTRSKYFEWYYGDLGISDEISVLCPIADQVTATVSIGKSGGETAKFTAKSQRRLRLFEPVLSALLLRHFKMEFPIKGKKIHTPAISTRLQAAAADMHGIKLSNRQAEVAVLILQGHSSDSAGYRLNISPQTVKVFRKQLYKRCNISSQAELFSLMIPLLEK